MTSLENVHYSRHARRADDLPLAADLHAGDADVPPRDYLLGAQPKLETGAFLAVVEHLVILLQPTFVIYLKEGLLYITNYRVMLTNFNKLCT